MEFENKMSEFIDGLSEEEFNTKFEEIWLEILRHEALLLHPNEVVKKEHTGDLICRFCSNLKIGGTPGSLNNA